MKRLFTVLLCLFFSSLVQGQDEVPDISFRAGQGALPEGWKLSTAAKPESCSFTDGIVTLQGPSSGNVYLFRPKLNLQKHVSYEFSCEARCREGGDYMIYYEYLKDKQYVSTIRRKVGDGKWTPFTITVARDEDTTDERVILRTMNSTKLEIRNVKLAEQNNDHGVRDSFPPSSPKTRFVHNGSFEWGDDYWNLFGSARVVRSDEDLGNRALLLRPNAMAVQQTIHLLPNTTYDLSWFTRIDLATAEDANAEAALQVAVRYMPAKEILNENPIPVRRDALYHRNHFEFTTPAGAPIIDVLIRNTGKIPLRVTQVYLHETVARDAANIPGLAMLNYRDSVFATSPDQAFTGTVNKTSTVYLKDKNGKTLAETKANPGPHKLIAALRASNPDFRFDASKLPYGDYRIEACTSEGISYSMPVHKYPPQKGEVVLNSPDSILVDGAPFFPFVMGKLYEDPKKPVMSYLCARSGLTGVYGNGVGSEERALKALDDAQRFGLKVILWISGDFAMEDNYAEQLETFLKKILTPKVTQHPALFAYNYCDEPWAREIPHYKFEPCAEIFRRLDPYHPLFINESPRGVVPENLYDYARWADLYGVDLYPLPASVRHSVLADKSMAAVGMYSEIYRLASRNRCPVLMWLQAYQWLPDGHPNAVLPTPPQIKFMCMDALLHGTKAISFFNWHTDKQDFYNGCFPACAEVARLEQVCRLGTRVPEPLHQAGLAMRAYQWNGRKYIFVLNETAKATPVDTAALGSVKFAWATEAFTGSLPPYSIALYTSDGAMPPELPPLIPVQPELEAEAKDFLIQFWNRSFPKPPLNQAEWIWFPGESGSAGKCSWEQEITIPKAPKEVYIQTTADNVYTLLMDGKVIGESSEWTNICRYDVTKICKQGTHKLRMNCENLDGPAAFFFILVATYPDGTQTIIKSDNTWTLTNASGVRSKAESFGKFGVAKTWDWTTFNYLNK